MRVNRQPRVKITLEVRPSMRPAYQAVTHKIVSYFEISQYQPGALMEVKFDANNLQSVVIIGPKASAWGGASSAWGGATPNVSTSQTYVVNGQTYSSLDQLPPEARQALGSVSGLLGDANQNGIPDIAEAALAKSGTPMSAEERARKMAELKAMLASMTSNSPMAQMGSAEDRVKKLAELKAMLDQGLITSQEYEAKKKAILDRM